jgi:hypothetical protein
MREASKRILESAEQTVRISQSHTSASFSGRDSYYAGGHSR